MNNEPVKQGVSRDRNGRFLPGNTGNPNGRPRNELTLTNLAREKLGEDCPFDPGKTWAQYLVDRWLGQSVENVSYFRELIERVEGKVLQPIGGEDGGPIKYEITTKDTETKQLTDRIIKGGQVVSNISLS
jgi:hypothetical protein